MSKRFTCDDTETLVAYLYDDIDPIARDEVTRHLAECGRCRDELASLGGVREALAEWTPPAPPLRFTVVSESQASNVVRPDVSRWQTVPHWAQLVAATLVLAVGAGIANVQVRRDGQGWTVSTGWMTPAVTPAESSDQVWRQAFAEFQQSVRQELASHPSAVPVAAVPATPPAPSDGAILQRVTSLVESSEKRQQQELARRVAQIAQDFDLQRQADFIRINQGLTRLEGRTSTDLAEQRRALEVVLRANLRPQQ
jgi:anti-sigma factor RsiW